MQLNFISCSFLKNMSAEYEKGKLQMQSKMQSLIEVAISTVVGFVTSTLFGMVLYPLFGHKFSVLQNVGLTLCFTVWSFIRSYYMRRFFNWLFSRKLT